MVLTVKFQSQIIFVKQRHNSASIFANIYCSACLTLLLHDPTDANKHLLHMQLDMFVGLMNFNGEHEQLL